MFYDDILDILLWVFKLYVLYNFSKVIIRTIHRFLLNNNITNIITVGIIFLGDIIILENLISVLIRGKINLLRWNIVIMLLIIVAMNIIIFMKDSKLKRLNEYNCIYKEQLKLNQKYQEEYELSIKKVRKINHDIKNNLIVIKGYAEKKDINSIKMYIDNILKLDVKNIQSFSYTGNIAIDSIINYKKMVAKNENIRFEVKTGISNKINVCPIDLGIVLGNLIDNAIEATKLVTNDNRYIQLKIQYDRGNIFICIINTYECKPIKNKNREFMSIKADSKEHGLGLKIIKEIIKKYKGQLIIDYTDDKFQVKVLLYGERDI